MDTFSMNETFPPLEIIQQEKHEGNMGFYSGFTSLRREKRIKEKKISM